MHSPVTCLNGDFLPANEARICITERGARFGDGVFETIRLEHGVPYQWESHLARLLDGLKQLRIPVPSIDWKRYARQLLHANQAAAGFLRITVSRGGASLGYLPLDLDAAAHWSMEYLPARTVPEAPCNLWLSSYQRPSLAALPVNHKLSHGINSTLALLEAREQDCDEALLTNARQHLCAAAAANFFWIEENRLFTPALETGCLQGTTRAIILHAAGADTVQCAVSTDRLMGAQAAFLSNSRYGIWPVASLQPMGLQLDPQHPLIAKLQAYLRSESERYYHLHSDEWKNHS